MRRNLGFLKEFLNQIKKKVNYCFFESKWARNFTVTNSSNFLSLQQQLFHILKYYQFQYASSFLNLHITDSPFVWYEFEHTSLHFLHVLLMLFWWLFLWSIAHLQWLLPEPSAIRVETVAKLLASHQHRFSHSLYFFEYLMKWF